MTIGEAMREARKRAGLSQDELATLVGVSQTCLSQYENDMSFPRIDLVEMLADALGITIDEYVGHGESRKRKPNADGLRHLQQVARVAGMKELGEKVMDLISDTIKAERGAIK